VARPHATASVTTGCAVAWVVAVADTLGAYDDLDSTARRDGWSPRAV